MSNKMSEISSERKYKVLIIGAGIAGLSAAEHLKNCGISDVLVLESSDRCGGRIHTLEFGEEGKIVEAGANWIHGGSTGNCVFNLANTHSLLEKDCVRDQRLGYFHLSGGGVVNNHLASTLWDLHAQLEAETERLDVSRKDENMKQYVERRCLEMCQTFPKEERDKVKSVFNFFKNGIAFHGGDDLELMSAWGYGQYQNIPGGDIKVPKGIGIIIKKLQGSLPQGSIRLNHQVVRIVWRSETEVVVTCKDGQQFTADHVVVTVSLGVLKKWKDSLFYPLLPPNKMAVIERTGFGRVGKIFLRFDRPFWQKSALNMCFFAWSDEDIEEYRGNQNDWWITSIHGFDEVLNNSEVLVGWIAGIAVEHVEMLPEKAVGATCAKVLRKFLNDPSIPDPCNVFVTKWCSNVNFLGSYSYMTSNNKFHDQTILEEPLPSKDNPRLLFAGEATNCQHFSTMHGARFSGLREAERIFRHSLGARL